MKKLSLSVAIALASICIVFTIAALADLAPGPSRNPGPPRPHENTVTLVIEAGNPGQEAQLWLPAGWYAGQPTAGTVDANPGGMSQLNTIVTGTALSLAIVFGGFWLARTRKELGVRNTATAAAILVVLGGAATFALANAAPPRNYKPVDPGTLRMASPNDKALTGTVRYYYGTDDGQVKLVIPAKKAE